METRTVPAHTPRTTRNESITRWSRSARMVLGIVLAVVIVTFAVSAIASFAVPTPPERVSLIHWSLFVATFMQYLLCLFFISFAAQNPRSDNRGLWIAGMVLLPWGILPVYWWAHVWNAPYVSDPSHDYNVPGGQLTPQAD
ncbi:hypothetical protein DB32_007887 [Sandaracinus amylolyticus]|uniref:Uncharacterized protein n=1 Tax=Sandaracinus amylolyticus TaxID=927083 RepID=A0A0F6YNU2_9BACT|nr:hypothetical protein DB32_007887 [Sandaracinus amylolyticus]